MRTSSRLGISLSFSMFLAVHTTSLQTAAHEAKSGWMYPLDCCSQKDCREVAAELVAERPEGYLIKLNGESVPYTDPRVRRSPDGLYHWCSSMGRSDTRTICLFVPPQGS